LSARIKEVVRVSNKKERTCMDGLKFKQYVRIFLKEDGSTW